MINILLVGIGPLGQMIAGHITKRTNMTLVGAVDIDPEKAGKDPVTLGEGTVTGVTITNRLDKAIRKGNPHAAILTTVSDLKRLTPQIEEIVSFGLPVVSTCEELSYPWHGSHVFAERIDRAAKEHGVPVLGTGVNPGFLMDSFPVVLTAVSESVERITVSRIQNAESRRVPFQRKIGAGLNLEEFEKKKEAGVLRHVGLTESMAMIAARIGWKLDRTEDIITPVIADHTITTDNLIIEKGDVSGVRQVGRGWSGGKERITLIFQASIGEKEPEDTVEISGNPSFISTIRGGINGDIATCAITLNAVSSLLNAAPGLRTMVDIPVVSYSGA